MRHWLLLGSLLMTSLSLLSSCGGDSAEADSPSGSGGSGGAASHGGSGGQSSGGSGGATSGGGSGSGGSGGAGGASTGNTPLPCDLEAFFVERCHTCHGPSPKFGAPMSLISREDLMAPSIGDPSLTVGQMIPKRLKDKQKPMPQPPSAPATAAEIALVEGWLSSGSPAGPAGGCGEAGAGGSAGSSGGSAGASGSQQGGGAGASGGGQAGGSSGNSSGGSGGSGGGSGTAGSGTAGSGGYGDLGCTPDVTIAPSAPWQMPAETADQYVCYGFDVPAVDAKRHITAITPTIDNDVIIHHILVLLADQTQPSSPTPCSALPPYQWKLLYGWGPGAPPHKLPAEAGFPVEKGETAHLVLQVHYSNLKHLSGQADSSGVKLCTTTDLRPYDADVMALGSVSFSIPAHSKKTLNCETNTAPLNAALPLHIFEAWPHMHLLGSAIHSSITHADGTETELGGTDSYSFYNQVTYPVEATIGPGDKVKTSCTWQNSTDSSVSFGEETSNEMCFNFLSYYPKINSSQWSWLVPASLLANCQ